MDLKTFVSQTLTQIVEGVQEAQERIAALGSGAALNPTETEHNSEQSHAAALPVEFDVAVLVSDEATQSSGEAVQASVGFLTVLTAKAAAGMDTKEGGSRRNETASRIRFTVMLAQPAAIRRKPKPQPLAVPSLSFKP